MYIVFQGGPGANFHLDPTLIPVCGALVTFPGACPPLVQPSGTSGHANPSITLWQREVLTNIGSVLARFYCAIF
jgi:hypothetical protein